MVKNVLRNKDISLPFKGFCLMRSFEAMFSEKTCWLITNINVNKFKKIVRTIKRHRTNWGLALINNVSRNNGFKRMLYTVPNVIEIKVRSPIPP